jgi:flagellar hook-associated protein 1
MAYFPTLAGYNSAKTGMMAMQLGLQIINNNISNANTPGYSRQRIDLQSQAPLGYSYIGLGKLGQVGQGLTVDGITRAHNQFLDDQVNRQQASLGYNSILSDTLKQVEAMLGEPAGSGITGAMQTFFEAAAALSRSPESLPLRHGFIQASQAFLRTTQDTAQQLQSLRTNLVGDPSVSGSVDDSAAALSVSSINSQLSQIANLNQQIVVINSSGGSANDLLDQRDQLLTTLSKQLNITVDYRDNGQVDIRLGTTRLLQGGVVNDTLEAIANTGPTQNDQPAIIRLATATTDITADITGGELGGILKMGGNGSDLSTPRSVLEKISTLFDTVATQMNALQAGGLKLDGTAPSVGTEDAFFDLSAGSNLAIFRYQFNSYFETHPESIAAATGPTFAGVGDGRNALAMAQLESTTLAGLGNKTPADFYNEAIATLGVDSHTSQENWESGTLITQQLEQQRQSYQGVNVEEEMVELVKFQRAFEASARSFQALDDALRSMMQII